MRGTSATRSPAWSFSHSRVPHGEDLRPPQLQADPRFWLRVAIAGGATFIVGAVWAIIVMQFGGWTHGLPREVQLLARLHRQLPAVLDWIVVRLPWLGTNFVFIPVLGPACWYLWRKGGRPDLAILVAVTTLGNYIVGTALKVAFERPRPALWLARGEYTGTAYPSGHAMAMTSVIGLVAVLLYEERRAVWPLVVWVFLLMATCYSRLYLGVHWPTDVVGGLLAGGTWLVGMLWAKERRPVILDSDRRPLIEGHQASKRGPGKVRDLIRKTLLPRQRRDDLRDEADQGR